MNTSRDSKSQEADALPDCLPFRKGYLGAQALMTSGPANWWKTRFRSFCMTSVAEARPYLERARGWVDGLELQLITHTAADVRSSADIAKCARDMGFDVFLCPRPYKYVLTLPAVPPELAAWTMNRRGEIVAACMAANMFHFAPDPLNPKAVDYLVSAGHESFYRHFEGVVNGYMWPEEMINWQGGNWAGPTAGSVPDYWRLPAYSDYSLAQWRAYCERNNVRHAGELVNAFPVDRPEMAAFGAGKTAYYPGYAVAAPATDMRAGDVPRPTGVWKEWYRYLKETYTANYLLRLSRHWHRLYGRPGAGWRGVIHFCNPDWMLSYDDCRAEDLLPAGQNLLGGYLGVDLPALAKAPEITLIVHEINDERFDPLFDAFERLVPAAKQGLMVWGGEFHLGRGDLASGWDIIFKRQPRVLFLYPLWNLIQDEVVWGGSIQRDGMRNRYRDEAALRAFRERLAAYRLS